MSAPGPLLSLTPEDQVSFRQLGFGAAISPPFSCVHQAFETQAANFPELVAVVDFEQTISYAGLERQANCLATQLRSRGIGPQTRVCILAERSIPMVVAIVATLKAGAAYVPLDGNVVSDTSLAHVLKDSNAAIVLAHKKFSTRVLSTPVLCLEDIRCQCTSSTGCEKPDVN